MACADVISDACVQLGKCQVLIPSCWQRGVQPCTHPARTRANSHQPHIKLRHVLRVHAVSAAQRWGEAHWPIGWWMVSVRIPFCGTEHDPCCPHADTLSPWLLLSCPRTHLQLATGVMDVTDTRTAAPQAMGTTTALTASTLTAHAPSTSTPAGEQRRQQLRRKQVAHTEECHRGARLTLTEDRAGIHSLRPPPPPSLPLMRCCCCCCRLPHGYRDIRRPADPSTVAADACRASPWPQASLRLPAPPHPEHPAAGQ